MSWNRFVVEVLHACATGYVYNTHSGGQVAFDMLRAHAVNATEADVK
jgi:hypothetical protein